jgi:RsiW-degrading membrane proteinase PrsW (M82 family)
MTALDRTAPLGLVRRPLFWIILAAFPTGLIAWLLISPGSFEPSPERGFAFLIGLAQLAAVLLLIFLLDTRRSVPVSLGILAFAWGVLVATPLAIYLNTVWIEAWTRAGFGTVAASMVAPIDEEVGKAVGVLVILALLLPRRINPFQGVMVGFLVGAGFEIYENVSYAANAASAVEDPSQSMAAVLETFAVRTSSGFLLHALCTGVVGAGIALALGATTRRARRIGLLATGGLLLIAIVLHALWDLPQLFTSNAASETWAAGLYAVIIGTFLTVWFLTRRADRRMHRAEEAALAIEQPTPTS